MEPITSGPCGSHPRGPFMKIDLTPKLRTIDNKPFQQPSPDGKSLVDWDLDLKDAISGALLAQVQGDFQLPVQAKLKIYRLAKPIDQANTAINLESDEITLIKEGTGLIYRDHQVGAIARLMQGQCVPAPPDPPATPPWPP